MAAVKLPRLKELAAVHAALPTMVYFTEDSVQAPEAVIQSLLNSRLHSWRVK